MDKIRVAGAIKQGKGVVEIAMGRLIGSAKLGAKARRIGPPERPREHWARSRMPRAGQNRRPLELKRPQGTVGPQRGSALRWDA